MLNKRNFLKSGATALVAGAGAPAALAAVRPSLGDMAGQASWQAHLGQAFEVDGHAVTLQAVQPLPSRQPGEQFSLAFTGTLPAGLGDGLHTLGRAGSDPVQLYLARTPGGLRADFCRLQG
jgi:hypothetical protein